MTRFARTFALWEVQAELPCRAVLACTNDNAGQELAAPALGASLPEAALAALRNLVGGLQDMEGGRAIAANDERFLPLTVLQNQPDADEEAESDPAEAARTWKEVGSQLHRQGYDLIFVHTTSSDLWQKHTLLTGTVLLQRLEA